MIYSFISPNFVNTINRPRPMAIVQLTKTIIASRCSPSGGLLGGGHLRIGVRPKFPSLVAQSFLVVGAWIRSDVRYLTCFLCWLSSSGCILHRVCSIHRWFATLSVAHLFFLMSFYGSCPCLHLRLPLVCHGVCICFSFLRPVRRSCTWSLDLL